MPPPGFDVFFFYRRVFSVQTKRTAYIYFICFVLDEVLQRVSEISQAGQRSTSFRFTRVKIRDFRRILCSFSVLINIQNSVKRA